MSQGTLASKQQKHTHLYSVQLLPRHTTITTASLVTWTLTMTIFALVTSSTTIRMTNGLMPNCTGFSYC